MKYAVIVLVIPILSSAFFGKSAEAIKCHQCNECADATNLTEAIECTKIMLAEAVASLTGKMTGLPVQEQGVSMIFEKFGLNVHVPPKSCFMLQKTFNNEDIVYRGCGVEIYEDECVDIHGIRTCICQGDGCNSGPATFVPV